MPTVGIIGYGFVGKACEHGFKDQCDILIYDPAYPDISVETVFDLYKSSSLIFVCVPSPMNSDGSIDSSILDETMRTLLESYAISSTKPVPVICIKTTVTPDKLKSYEKSYGSWLRITMSPEYLTEANYLHDFIHPKALVVGGKTDDTQFVADFFDEYSACVKPYPVYTDLDLIGAGVVKYQENCFLAMKVIFMNQFYDILKESGSETSWENLQAAFHSDKERMGNSHWRVPGPDGDRGIGGKCFIKDINALIQYAKSLGCNIELMEKVDELNLNEYRTNKDWLNIPGVISKSKKSK